jgi:hypothetical protein
MMMQGFALVLPVSILVSISAIAVRVIDANTSTGRYTLNCNLPANFKPDLYIWAVREDGAITFEESLSTATRSINLGNNHYHVGCFDFPSGSLNQDEKEQQQFALQQMEVP